MKVNVIQFEMRIWFVKWRIPCDLTLVVELICFIRIVLFCSFTNCLWFVKTVVCLTGYFLFILKVVFSVHSRILEKTTLNSFHLTLSWKGSLSYFLLFKTSNWIWIPFESEISFKHHGNTLFWSCKDCSFDNNTK